MKNIGGEELKMRQLIRIEKIKSNASQKDTKFSIRILLLGVTCEKIE